MGRLRVGLTGGIASGKSTVANLLSAHGAQVIDSDLLAREVVAAGTDGLQAVAERFGPSVISADGTLDRPALGALVFPDPAARADLEAIIHPRVRARAAELERESEAEVVVQMIPLLVETQQQHSFDLVAVVDLPVWLQSDRLRQRNGFSDDEVSARLASQTTRGQRLRAAGLVIDNSGTRGELAAVVDQVWRLLWRRVAVQSSSPAAG
ncbi:dephospho-CoA kinase [Aestuariimicrobium ganziense]|uniref:dephospho-CoA kinase n=1 Tax=Aestuariimicrobium ganziense TaxID=2773677 RepID=UPI0019426081|nr:dephospho-CoA kinase [Aestuariimicrobium ganziense]